MHTLSKTDYIQYLACKEELWIYKNREELIPPFSIDAQYKVEQGKIIDKLAQDLFKKDFRLGNRSIKSAQVSFQKKAIFENYIAIADVVIQHSNNQLEIIEVKASTGVKSEHIHDIAFQQMVFEKAGYQVTHSYLIHVNNNYRMEGEVKLNEFLVINDVTNKVQEILDYTKEEAPKAFEFINEPKLQRDLQINCALKDKCLYLKHYHEPLPDYSVYDISRIQRKKLQDLLKNNILSIKDVPANFKLSNNQRLQVEIAQQNKIIIKKDEIKSILYELEYPLYFIDYESFSYVFPPQEGLNPYQQMVFQYSLHIVEEPNKEARHVEYLLRSKKEPLEHLVQHMKDHIHPTKGTVIVWNEAFEKTRNKEMAALFPLHAEFMYSMNDRMFDLMKIFQKGLYLHPKFKGSASIKKVLPILCPELSYQDLDIQNGSAAVIKWHHATDGRMDVKESTQTFDHLLHYCHLDTWAMVRIWEELRKV